MKRHASLVPLSHDHYQGLILAQVIKKGGWYKPDKGLPTQLEDKVRSTLNFYERGLSKHFKLEEEILIPAVQGVDREIDTWIAEIVREHCQIKVLINLLREETNLEVQLDELGRLLEVHIRKEERQLFQKIQAVISEEVLLAVKAKIEAQRDPLSCSLI